MKKVLVAGSAALFAAVSLAASAVPAAAGGSFSFGFGGYGPYDPWSYGHHGGIYVDVGPGPVYGKSKWQKHVNWCFNHYKTYDPDSNHYMSKWGPKECNSPYF